MKIMQVMAGAAQGGAETAFEDLCLAFHQNGINQKLVLKSGNVERVKKLRAAGLDVETLPFGGALDFYTPWKLKKIIADYKPHIVQTWMSRAAIKTPPSSLPKSYLKVSRLGGYYGMKYFRTTDYFVTNTNDIRAYLMKNGIEENHVCHINNFADMDPPDHPIARKSLNTPEDAFVVLCLARYHQVKGLDVLIKAAAKVENCYVWLAGEGPLEQDLKHLAKEQEVTERIHFLGWRTDRAALLQAADICAVPSRFEPFGNSFVQAWAQRTPLVCSTADGPRQYVKDGEDALVFEIDDVEGLRHALQTLKDNRDLGTALAEKGFQRFQAEFGKESTVNAYLSFYRDILTREGIDFM